LRGDHSPDNASMIMRIIDRDLWARSHRRCRAGAE
jgi:hypothetical protein